MAEPPERKGRSEQLHQLRNEMLVHRYYYHVKIGGKQYAKTLEILQQELFISERTIVNTVSECSAMLRELNEKKPTLKYFNDKYPFFKW